MAIPKEKRRPADHYLEPQEMWNPDTGSNLIVWLFGAGCAVAGGFFVQAAHWLGWL